MATRRSEQEVLDVLARLCAAFSNEVRDRYEETYPACPQGCSSGKYKGDPLNCPAYAEALLLFLAVALLCLSGCGGETLTTDPSFHQEGSCAVPSSVCSTAPVRGSYVCPDGGLSFYCCGLDDAALARLREQGDYFALRCEP